MPTVRSGGVTLQTLQGDSQERLIEHVTRPATRSHVLRLTVVAAVETRSVMYGRLAGGERGVLALRVDGEPAQAALEGGGTSYAAGVLPPGEPHRVALWVSSDPRGTLLPAVYAPVDDPTP